MANNVALGGALGGLAGGALSLIPGVGPAFGVTGISSLAAAGAGVGWTYAKASVLNNTANRVIGRANAIGSNLQNASLRSIERLEEKLEIIMCTLGEKAYNLLSETEKVVKTFGRFSIALIVDFGLLKIHGDVSQSENPDTYSKIIEHSSGIGAALLTTALVWKAYSLFHQMENSPPPPPQKEEPPPPTLLYRWKTLQPYEVRVLRDSRNVIVQLYDRRVAKVEKELERYTNAVIADLGKCIRKWTRGNQELRLFLTSNPRTVNCFQLDFSSKKLSTYVFENWSEDGLRNIKSCAHPIFKNDGSISFSTDSQPATPAETWSLLKGDECEVGLTRIESDGSEEELVRLSANRGLNGEEDFRLIRKKQNSREDLICEVFDRSTGMTRVLELKEYNSRAPIEKRIEIIFAGQLTDVNYCENNLPQIIRFVKCGLRPIRFAKDKNLHTLPLSEIKQTVMGYLTHPDANGRQVSCYDIRTFLVEKSIENTRVGRKPLIHIHFERNRLVSTLKPVVSFFESLLKIGDAGLYEGDIASKQEAMGDLVLRNSELSSDPNRRQEAIEGFKMAFARCGSVDVYLACDRTWGRLKCDDKTWTMTSAGWGQGIRNRIT